jgi:hypothetical protein
MTRAEKIQRLANLAAPLPICVRCARRSARCPCPYDAPKVYAQPPAPVKPRVVSPWLRERLTSDDWKRGAP